MPNTSLASLFASAALLGTVLAHADPSVQSAAPAAASPPTQAVQPVALAYTLDAGAQGCADERALRAAVAEKLGHDPFSSDAMRTVSVEVSRGREGFVAQIWTVEDGEP